jgi:hypothetical protein
MNKFEPGERVRVIQAVANPFWHWVGEVENIQVLGGEIYYRIKSQGLLLLFHESWLSKVV